MSAVLTLDSYASWSTDEVRELVLQVARESGPAGFTSEDVRLRAWWASAAPSSLSATLASLVARRRLTRVGEEIARFRSSKARKIGRYALTVQGDNE